MANNAKESVATEVADVSEQTTKQRKKKIVAKDVDTSQMITVINGFQGRLVYKSLRTGEEYTWSEYGDEQEIELRELKNIKSSKKKFFTDNWFMFGEEFEWVIDYLGLSKYYSNAIGINEFDSVFDHSPEEAEEIINGLSAGQKRSVGYRARQLIEEGKIDSIKLIGVLERVLGTELVEH